MSQFVNQILPSYVAGAGFVKVKLPLKPSTQENHLSQENNPFQILTEGDQFLSRSSAAPTEAQTPMASRLLGKHLFV